MPSKQFFHVSHRKELPGGLQLNTSCLNLPEPLPPNILPHAVTMVKIAKEYFPSGLSFFGTDYLMEPLRYLRSENFGYVSHSMTIEIVFELIRKVRFPLLPSRYESFFACETLEEAKALRAIKYINNWEGNIFVVESENYTKLDMSLLTLGGTYIEGFYYAEHYWSGGQSERPVWEYLLSFPVKVIDVVSPSSYL